MPRGQVPGPRRRLRRLGVWDWMDRAGAFIATALGVTVVTLTALLYASGAAAVPERFANAPIVVQSPAVRTPADPFPESRPWSSDRATALAQRLAAVEGVDGVVLDRTFYAQVIVDGRVSTVETQGHGWSSSRLGPARLLSGAAPQRAGEVALDRAFGLSPGSPVSLLTAAGPAPYVVSGVVDSSGIYLADAEASRLAPGVRVIGLLGRPGPRTVADVVAVVGAAGRVLTGAARSALESREEARTRWIGSQVLAGMAALALFVSLFVVAATFTLRVNQRRHEIALLRIIGALPRQIRRRLYLDALAVGVAAALTGVLLGVLLAPAVGDLVVASGFEPAAYRVQVRLWPVVAAFAAGPLVALAGVWSASRRAARIRPLEALREAAVETRAMSRTRWIGGVVFTAAGIAATAVTAATTDTQGMATFSLLAAMALIVGVALLAPAVVPALVRVLTLPFVRHRGATAMVVRESALTAVRRTASTAAPVLLTVAFTVLIGGNVQTTANAYALARGAAVRAGSILAPDGTPGLSDAAAAAAPGAALLETDVYVGDTVIAGLGVDPVAFAAASNGLTVVSGRLDGLRDDDAVVVTQAVATAQGWLPGTTAAVTLADGNSLRPRVAAVVSDASAPAGVLLPRAVVRAHDPSALSSAVLLSGPVPPGQVVGARVVDVASYAREAEAEEDRLVWTFTLLLIGVSAGYGSIAVANTLLMAVSRRRSDLRVLRLSGATTRQVRLMLAAEAALVVTIGASLGGAAAATALWGGVAALRERTGVDVPVVLPWTTIGVVVGACLVLAVTASIVPARVPVGSRSLSGRRNRADDGPS